MARYKNCFEILYNWTVHSLVRPSVCPSVCPSARSFFYCTVHLFGGICHVLWPNSCFSFLIFSLVFFNMQMRWFAYIFLDWMCISMCHYCSIHSLLSQQLTKIQWYSWIMMKVWGVVTYSVSEMNGRHGNENCSYFGRFDPKLAHS